MKTKMKVAAGIGAALTAGALFGPITPASAGHTNTLLEAVLNGRKVVPATPMPPGTIVGDRDGRGEAYVFGIDNDPNTLCYTLTAKRIKPATGAHIHEGLPGMNGPIVAALAPPADGNAADCLTEGEPGKFPTGETGIVQRILANPNNFYVQVHNTPFPDGVIRGQLRLQED